MPLSKEQRYTAEEFFKLVPETNEQMELIGGQIVAQAAPGRVHHDITTEIFSSFRSFIKSRGGDCKPYHSPYDVKLSEYDVVQPDVFVLCDPKKDNGARVEGAPDLVVEVVSTNRYDDLVRKLALYKDAGVREYWIVDPLNKRTLVYCFETDNYPSIFTFDQPIPVGIYGGELTVTVGDMI